jgi:glycosyltransferase involved in cell wall biosynthesis
MVAYTFYESDNRVRRYAQTLLGEGYEVDAFALRREGLSPEEVVDSVRVFRLQKREINEKNPFGYLFRLLRFFFKSAWAVTREHMRCRYDLIHVHSVPDFEVFATLIPKLMGARIILDIHDIVPELYATKFRISDKTILFRLLVFIERLSIKFADHTIIANHLWHQRLLERSARPEECSTVLNYPDRSVFYRRPRKPRGEGEFVMFYPGTLSWHQGVDLVIRAMALLRAAAPDLRFIVYGDGHERDALLALVKELDLESQVSIQAEKSVKEVAETMADVDLGVEPKRKRSFANEALSTKILEFMAMDVPVLASDTRVHEMYFKDAIEYFESDNIEQLAAKILELKQNQAKRDSLRARGTNLVQQYDWHEKKREYLDLVDRLVGAEDPPCLKRTCRTA